MKVILLSSSRADYSIYLPLMKKLKNDPFFDLRIVAFGTHTSQLFGKTIDNFFTDDFKVHYSIESLLAGDSAEAIATSTGLTTIKFSAIWNEEKDADLILCLGDRYEMFAAVSAAVPFNIPIAHIHGGETTLGAIDNVFRNALTCMAQYHFTSTKNHSERVTSIIGNDKFVFHVGALSIDNISQIKLLTTDEFNSLYKINLDNPVLVTFHPETVAYENNQKHILELIGALKKLDQQIIITMPNADTSSSCIRKMLLEFAQKEKNVFAFESLGTTGYFSCLNYCDFLVGNSSSGIIEAASFGKYVVNLGNRQQGREAGQNVLHCDLNQNNILHTIQRLKLLPKLGTSNVYGDGHASDKIIDILKHLPSNEPSITTRHL